MKKNTKYLNIIIILLITIVISGCSNENKKCINEHSNIKTTFNFKYNKNTKNIDKININYIYNYDKYDAYIDMQMIELENKYKEFDNIEGFNYKIKKNYDNIIVDVIIDNNENLKSIDFKLPFDLNDDITTVLKKLNDYNCN